MLLTHACSKLIAWEHCRTLYNIQLALLMKLNIHTPTPKIKQLVKEYDTEIGGVQIYTHKYTNKFSVYTSAA